MRLSNRPYLLPLFPLMVAALFVATPLRAFDLATLANDSSVNLWRHGQVLIDQEASLSVEQVAASSEFVPTQGDAGGFGYSAAAIWVRLPVENSSDQAKRVMLRVGMTFIDSSRLYLPTAQGAWNVLETGDHLRFDARPYPFHEPVIPFDVPAHSANVYYLRVQSTSTVWIPLTLHSEHSFATQAANDSVWHGIFFGVMGVLVFYNLVLFFSIRDPGFLYFSLGALASCLFMASMLGYSNQFFWPQAIWWADRATNFFSALGTMVSVMLLRHFIDLRRCAPKWDRLFLALQWAFLLFVPMTLFAPFRLAAMPLAITVELLSVAGFVMATLLSLQGVRAARWYLAMWTVHLGVIGYRILELFAMVPMVLGDKAMEISLGLSFTLLSFALADKLNAMRQAMEQAQRAANELLEEEVQARTRALTEATEAARAASRAKGEFLAVVSHEIRNPLTAVLGNAQLLRETPLAPGQQELVAGMEQGSSQVLMLLKDFLDLSRIESGEMGVERTVFSLSALVSSAVESSRSLVAQKPVTLQCEIEEMPPWLYGDPRRVRQVLFNFIGNAVRFTDRGEIIVSAHMVNSSLDAATVCFAVADTGVGIENQYLDRLFKPFSQLHTATREGGTGLGLAICKRLVESMGGEIGVESTPGEGSTFWFTLPFAIAAAPALQGTESARPVSLAILLVEDVASNRQIVEKLLTREGHRVLSVESGEAAILQVQRHAFDLVLMDMQMPGIGGLEAVRRIRALPGCGRDALAIFAFTASILEGSADECRSAGVEEIIPKPLDLEFLNERLVARFGAGGVYEREPVTLSTGGALDGAMLDRHLSLLGRADMEAVIALYLKNNDAALRDVEELFRRGDMRGCARLAHRLAGAADTVGMRELSALARRLEASLDNVEAAEVQGLIASLPEIYATGLAALGRWCATRGLRYEAPLAAVQ